MNASRLRGIIAFLLEQEKKRKFQTHLQSLSNALQNLAGEPNNTQHQTETANSLTTLQSALADFTSSLTPAQKTNLAEIKAYQFFSNSIVDEIQHSIAQNPMTPSVANELVKKLLADRQNYLTVLDALQKNFSIVGIELSPLKPGEAEAGVLLPRDLFNNELEGLQKELRVLNQILRTFYEIANVGPEKIEIRQISTSDPIFFLGMDISVLIHFGHALKWCADTIKAIGELKNFIDMAKALDIDPTKTAIFDKEIEERVKKRIDEKVQSMLADYKGDPSRKAELDNSLHLALGQLLERVERGVTVEIRLIPPPKAEKTEASGPDEKEQAFAELDKISKELEFPKIQGQPVLKLSADGPSGVKQP